MTNMTAGKNVLLEYAPQLTPAELLPALQTLVEAVKFTPEDLRAARGLLDWSRDDLKAASGVSKETIKNIEHGVWNPSEETHLKIVAALSRHGIQFFQLNAFSRFGLRVGGVIHVENLKEQTDTQTLPA